MSRFGQNVGSVEALKESLESGGAGGAWIKGVPEEGLTVRFLQEPDEWYVYREHYNDKAKRYYPCVGESEGCPGCQIVDENGRVRKPMRYITNVLNLTGGEEDVIILKLPKTLAETMIVRYERYKTLLDRDYDLIRSGKGLNTTYDAIGDDKLDRNVSKYDLHDLEQALEDAWEEAWGGSRKEEARPPKSKEYNPVRDGDPDLEPFVAPEVEDELESYTEEELGSMAIGQLRALAKDFDIEHDRATNKATLIEYIMEAQ